MKRMRTLTPLACVLVILLASCETDDPTAPAAPTAQSSSSLTSTVPSTAGLPTSVPGTAAIPESTGATPTAAPELGSVDKIEAAERAGKIDHDTALVYELYAALDYGSLPPEYQSDNAAEDPEATTILAELRERLDKLRPDLKAKIEPFFRRPTGPDSFWARRQPAQGPSLSSMAASIAPMGLAQKSTNTDYKFVDAKAPVRVWYAPELGGSGSKLAGQLAGEIDSSGMWGKEKGAMLDRTPCGDEVLGAPYNGGNGSLDIYLINPAAGLNWNGRRASLGTRDAEGNDEKLRGATVPESDAEHCGRITYIALDGSLPFDRLKNTTAHEMFHAFQLSFNNSWMTNRAWWSESSATWAEDLVYPTLNFEQARLRSFWSETRGTDGPLDNAYHQAAYGAYIWPFYLRQKADGDETVVGQIWQDTEGAEGTEGTAPIDTMRRLQGWHDKFKEFALWNWNKEPVIKYRDAGKPLPESVLAQHASCLAYNYAGDRCIMDVGTREMPITVWHDSVSYYQVSPGNGVLQLIFKLAAMPRQDGAGMQAIITIGEAGRPGYKVNIEDWSKLSERKFCLDQEDVSRVVLVISNSSTSGAYLEGNIGLDARKEGCPSKANLSYTSSSNYDFHYRGPGVNPETVTGVANTTEGVQSTWDVRFDGRRTGSLWYVFTATNQISLSGSGNWTGKGGGATIGTTEWLLSGGGVSHNPSLPGDDAYKYGPFAPVTPRPTANPTASSTANATTTPQNGYSIHSVQPSTYYGNPVPYKGGAIELYKRDGKDRYRIILGMSQIAPAFTYVSRLSGCKGRMRFTETYDNVTMQVRSVLEGDPTCMPGARSGTLLIGPYTFGFIAVDQYRPSLDVGLGAWIGGTYDPATRLLEGHEAVQETTCTRVRGIDPLNGVDIMYAASTYYGPNKIGDDNTTCKSQYILDWHVQLPPPK